LDVQNKKLKAVHNIMKVIFNLVSFLFIVCTSFSLFIAYLTFLYSKYRAENQAIKIYLYNSAAYTNHIAFDDRLKKSYTHGKGI